ncbi:MAG: hypothetical protein CL797_08795 [Chromatiales bacterium]|nr:hypothetical protein [Chromatiales bacterium]
MAFCSSALLASGLEENDQRKLNGSADVVNDLLPSSVTVSPTRTVTIGPVLATALAMVAGAGSSADALSLPPLEHPAANTTSMNANKLPVSCRDNSCVSRFIQYRNSCVIISICRS